MLLVEYIEKKKEELEQSILSYNTANKKYISLKFPTTFLELSTKQFIGSLPSSRALTVALSREVYVELVFGIKFFA
jgi:hypothetical protein